ncbi:MAG: YDG domain-containing protein, partial [Flavobacterium sp.]|uniref:beta strand repeat-containing protein n=1 Tax=Flavobacterium sp. TaxID=239 RepID=UPI00326735CD
MKRTSTILRSTEFLAAMFSLNSIKKTKTLLALFAFFLIGSNVSFGQTYFDMSSANYSQAFTGFSTAYPTNMNGLAVNTGSYPTATTVSAASNGTLGTVGSSSAVGYDSASSTKLVLLTSGATDNTGAVACDLNLNFSGRTAGTLSFDYSLVFNTSVTVGRASSLLVYASADGGTNWTTLTGPYTVYNTTGNSTANVAVSSIALPSSFNGAANCKLRFYEYNGGTVIGSPSGSRPRIGVDNIAVTSTSAGTTAPTLTAAAGATVDAPFDVTFTDAGGWAAAITGVTVGGTALTAGYTVGSNKITFTPSASVPAGLLQSSGTKTISVSAATFSPSSVSQVIGVGAANKLAMNTQPAAPATNGAVLATQPKVNIVDQYGNTTASTASITAAVGAGTWTLGGTTSVAAVAGLTTYSGLTATSAASVTGATIAFTSSGLTGVTSGTFNIPSPPPVNDLCANATVLTVNGGTSGGTMVLSTNTANSLTYASSNNDVWFKFTPLATGSHTISLTFTLATNRDMDFDVFAGASCPTSGAAVTGYTAHGAASVTTETVTNTFTFGTTYYIRAIDFGSNNGGAFNIGITGPVAATITGTATATAFTTTYGTASTQQSFAVSGTGLSANLIATAPTGFEVSSDGTTYGTTATFTQTSGSASGTLRIRLKANAAVTGSYNSQNIVLSSTGATSANITTAASGNTVTAKALTVTADNRTKAYNTVLTLGTLAFSTNGLANSETVGGVTLSAGGAASTASTPVGTYPIVASAATGGTFTASNYTITYVDGVLTITQASQTITALTTPLTKVYGDGTYSIATTSTSGLAVAYGSSDSSIASVASDGTVTIHLPGGPVTLTASQAGDSNYTAATNVTQVLTVNPKNLTITGVSAVSKNYDGNADATLTGTPSLVGIVGSDVVSVTGTATATFNDATVGTNKPVTVLGYTLNGANASYYTLTQPTLSADIIATTPTIFTTGTLSAVTTVYGTASSATTFSVSAQSLTEGVLITAPAGFQVSSDDSTYAGSVTVGTTGNLASTTIYVRLAATTAVGTYSGDVTLTSSGAVSKTVATVSSSVSQKPLTITGLTGVDKTYDGSATATVTGTASLVGVVGSDDVSLSGTPSYSFADANASAIAKPITVLGYTLNGTAAGNYSVSQPTGLTAFINKANQTIAAISASETRTFGDPTYSVATTATSGLTVTYLSSNTAFATVSTNGTVTIVGAGSTTITASQAGNGNYNPAADVTQALTINKASQSLTALTTPVNKTFGDAAYSASSTASSGLIVSYSSDTPAVATVASNGLVTIVGVGSAIITASQGGNANYDAATSVTQQLNVAQASQTITFGALANKTTSDAAFNLTATASSGLTVSYASSNPAVATVSGNTVTIVGAGTTTITASQAGNTNYSAATSVNQTLTVLAVISKWTFDGITVSGSASASPNITAGSAVADLGLQTTGSLFSAVHASSATPWTTPSGNATAKSITASNWAIGDYWQFKVNSSNYHSLGLTFDTTGSNTGPNAFKVQYSTNGTSFTDLPSGGYSITNDSWSATGSPKAVSVRTFDLSALTTLANKSAIYIRLVGNSTTAISGTFGSGGTNRVDGFTVTGTPCDGAAATVTAGGATTFCQGGSVTLTASAGASYLWSNGETTQAISATATGSYSVTVTSANGCSAVSSATAVTVNQPTSSSETVSACDTYTWSVNGTTYTSSGTYTSVGTNAAGCTDTKTLVLTINTTSDHVVPVTACDTYTWSVNGATYTTSGIYTGTTTNCVTEKLDLTITPSSTTEYTQSACDSYTWSLNGQTYTASGNYNFVTGCHTDVLHLTITPSSINTTTVSVCDTYTWSVNGQTYTASGLYTGTTANCVTQKLDLTITPSSTTEYTQSACDSYTWFGTPYTTSGDYTHVVGCHTDILHLTVTPSSTNTTEVEACDSYTWDVTGLTYTDSDEYTATVGCVTETLLLTINNSSSNSESATACDTYTWPVNDVTYTESGTYTSTSTNASGCPHTETLVLTITP